MKSQSITPSNEIFGYQSSSLTAISEKTFWTFLKNSLSCLQWIMPNRKQPFKAVLIQTPFVDDLIEGGQRASSVNVLSGDYHYNLPGASPPTCDSLGFTHQSFTPKYTFFQPIMSQIMNQLSISPPPDKQRMRALGARFDDKSKRWVSTSPPLPDVGANCHESVQRTDLPSSARYLTQSFKAFAGVLVLTLFTAFSALGQKVVDIKLSKLVDNAQPTIGQQITFTIYAKNEGPQSADSVIVRDVFPTAGATFGTSTATAGTVYTPVDGKWVIPSIAAGDSVKLELTGTVTGRGVYFNIAELVALGSSSEDSDSNPGNGDLGEDDIATACFSVPLLWYPGDEYTVSLSALGTSYSNVVWSKLGTNGLVPITGIPSDSASVSNDTLTIKGTGRFSFTAQVNTSCPATGCCDIVVIPGPLGSIGDFVWKDVNDNGRLDSGEPGVSGVLVRLFQKNEGGTFVKVDSVNTSLTGAYTFGNLLPGEYQVQFVGTNLPVGCILSPKQNQAGVPDSLDSDANPTTGFSQIVTIDPEQGGLLKDNPTIDAALFSPLGSIGDFVWKDLDNDGIQDGNEPGVNNVQIILYQKNQGGTFVPIDTTLTANNPVGGAPGYYLFDGLSLGEYQVQIVKGSLPVGCVLSDSTNKGSDDTLDNDFNPTTGLSQVIVINPTLGGINKDNPTIDGALYSPLGSIGDFVWKDLNDNGQQDSGEPGVRNVRVILWTSQGGNPLTAIDTTFTDNNGYYLFSNLVGGTYQVMFDPTSLPDTCQLSLNQNVGSDLTDNDANPTTGVTAPIVIDPTKTGIDKDNLTVDAAVTNFDLALTKSLAAGQSSTVQPGSNVTFTLTVKNEGSMIATAIVLRDSLPVGMTLNDSDWTAAGQIATLNVPIASLAPGASTTVDITVTVNANFSGSSLTNYAQIQDAKDKNGNPVKDKDSTPGNGFTKGEDDDDDEPINVSPAPVFDLALLKNLAPGQASVVNPGANVTFRLTVTNQGNVPATAIVLSDSLPVGMTLNDSDWTAAGQIATLNVPIASLAPGASTTVDITVTVNANFSGSSLTNYAQIQDAKDGQGNPVTDIDSTPGNGFTKGEDDDDDEPITVTPAPVFDLALLKNLAPGQASVVNPGANVTFRLTVTNQGNVPATAIVLSDSLPVGMTLNDSDWTAAGQIATLNVPIASLAPGASTTVDITVTVNANFSGSSLTNYAQIKDAKDGQGNPVTDVDSTPGNGFTKGEDDDDDEPITVTPTPVFDLALLKNLAPGQASVVNPGANVTFRLTVTNQGNVPATAIVLSDSLPVGMTLNDSDWTAAGQIATLNVPIASLAPGASTTVDITVTVNANFSGSSLTNYAQIQDAKDGQGNPVTDVDSTPGNGFTKGEDDDDDEPITVTPTPVFDLALLKNLAPGQASVVDPGANVTFRLTVTNQGNVPATAIVLSDSLPVGMSLNDSDWTAAGQIATLNVPIASLAPGASTTVDITVTVNANFTGSSLTNYAQIKDAKDGQGNPVTDVDSTPGNGFTKGEDDDDDEPITIRECPIPPTPTCGSLAKNTCPNSCVNLNDFIHSDIRTPGGRFEWHAGPRPTDPIVADPTKVCVSGVYYLFEVAACGVYSNGAHLDVELTPCYADLTLAKTVNNTTPSQGDTVTYSIAVTNLGPNKATNVEVTDTIKAGLQYVSGSAAWVLNGTVLTASIDSILVNQTVTLTFKAKVVGTGTIKNFAQVTKSDQPDPNSTPNNGGGTPKENDEDDVDITVKVPCAIPPTPTCGGIGENTCPDTCVNLNNFIHSEIRTPGGKFEWYTTSNHLPGTLVADPTKVCTSGTYYLFEVAACGEYSNGALFQLNIKPCVTLTDLSVEKSVVEAGPYTVGQTITYKVIASNNGPVNATGVTVTDVLPASLTFVSASPAGEYNSATGIWTVGNLAVSANRTLEIRATLNAVGSTTNTAIIKGPNNDPNKAGNDTSRVNINVGCVKPDKPILACATTNICLGDSTTIHAIGCAGGIVTWSNGATGTTIVVRPSQTTTYTATCKKNGCESDPSNAISIHVNTPTTPAITASPSTTICKGSSVVLTAANCAGTIRWSTGATGAQITVTPDVTTSYSAICKIGTCESAPASIAITVTPGGPVPEVVCSTDKVCPGESVTLQVNNCAGIVEWSTGETGTAIVVYPTQTTTYWAVCNLNGCKARSKDYTIKVVPVAAPTVTASSSTVICNNGSATLTAAGCEGEILWSNGATGASIVVSPNTTTSYTATCKVGNCTSEPSAPVTITVGNPTPVVVAASKTLICAGDSTVLTASGECTGTVVWSNGATGSSIVVRPASTTEYTAICKVGTCESQSINKVKVTVTTAGSAPTVVSSKPSICAGDSVTLTASGCAGTVVWSTGAVGATSIVVKPNTTTTYTASCRTNGQCDSAPGSVTVTVGNNTTPPTITVSPSGTVCAGSTVTLTASGCVGGTITWNTGATTSSISVVVNNTTTYTAICKIGNCSSNPASATVNVVPAPEKPVVICSTDKVCPGEGVTLQVPNCLGVVHWSTGETGEAIVVHPTETTTYTAVCKVGDCSSPVSADYTIKVIPVPVPTVSASPASIQLGETSVLTASGCDGEVTWSNGMVGASIVVNPSETTSYTATCKVGNCTSAASVPVKVTVGNCVAPQITASSAVICEGSSVTLSASGCEGGNIEWSNGSTGNSITVNPIGTTTYTAVCKKGDCTSNASNAVSVVVTKVNTPTIVTSATHICKGEQVSLSVSGCEGSVLWSTGANSASITVTPQTTTSYTAICKVGDCESAASAPLTIVVGVPDAPTIQASKTNLCFGESVTLTAQTACAGYIQWSNGQIGSSITLVPAASTIYVAYCCNNENCKSVASNTVNVTVAPKVTTPQVVSLANVCPVKTVDLASAVKNYTAGSGLTMEFHVGNTPSSAVVANPSAVGETGTYYVFFRSTTGCYSEGVAIHVLISSCETTPCETNPATADAGADASICAALEYKLNGKIGGVATSAIWSTTGTGRFSNPLALDATYYPSLEDLIKGDVILTLTTNDPDGEGNCQAGKDDLKLVFEGIKFRPQIVINGTVKPDTLPQTITICQGDTVKLSASEQQGYQVKWFKDGQVLFPASDKKSWDVTEPGTYSYSLVDEKRCCSVPSAYITVVVKALPTPIVKNLRNTCPSTTVDLTTALDNSGNYTVQFKSAAELACTCLVGTPEAVGAGTYYVVYKKDGCYSAPAAIEVKIFDCATDTLRSDLNIVKSVDKNVVALGEQVTYNIVVSNYGPHDATNVDVRDIMPSELEVISTSGMTNTNGVLLTRLPVLAAGASDTLTVVAKAKTSGIQVTNRAEISYADQVDPQTDNNRSSVSIVVSDGTVAPSIGVALAVDNIEPKGNGDSTNISYDVTYKIIVKNVGNVPLTNLQVVDSITHAFAPPVTYTVVGTPTVSGNTTATANAAYNGTTDKDFLTPGTLPVGAEAYIYVTYNVVPHGNNGPFLGSVIAKGSHDGTVVSDISNKGTVVDPPVNTATPVRFDLPSALIGLSKSVGTPIVIGDGKFKIPYTISVTNLGTSDLTKVQVEDDLGLTFGSKAVIVGKPLVTADEGFTVDSTYTGQGLLTKLLVDSLSALPKGKTRSVQLAVIVSLYNPDSVTTFNNIAIGRGITEAGVMTADTSTTGNDADPDNDLDPRNNSESTAVSLNSTPGNGLLGLALSIKDTLRKGDGSLNVTYRVILKNYGAGTLTNVQVADSLTKVYSSLNGASYQLVGTPTASDVSTLRINPDFDGDRDANLLIAEQSRLAGGRTDSLFFTINVTTDGRLTPYQNRVLGTALAGQNTVSDYSTNGLNPDPNGDNDPTSLAEAEFTPIVIISDGGLFIPEGFSPNGDGINDKFVIRHPSGTKIVLEIYNRWMNLVYRSNDYQNDWEGGANVGVGNSNQAVPVGTYFYNVILLDQNGGEIKKSSRFMTINR